MNQEDRFALVLLAIAVVAAFPGATPVIIIIVIIIVVAAFPDELSNEKLDRFTGIRRHRRYMRDVMINLTDVLIALTFRMAKGAQGDAASGNQAAPEGASRKTSEVHKQAPCVVSKIACCGGSFASVQALNQCTAPQTFIIWKGAHLQRDSRLSHRSDAMSIWSRSGETPRETARLGLASLPRSRPRLSSLPRR